MSKILYEVYKNDIKDSESAMYGKYYARLKSIETMNISKMAKHISEHGSVFTEDVVEGVMKKFKSCLIEMLLESKKVKVNGLGTFYLTCECQKGGADKEEDFNVKENLKALHIRFLPDQAAEDNLSSREFIKKAEFFNIKNLMKTDGSAVSGSDGDDSGDADGKTDGEGTSEGSNGSSSSSGSSENQNPSGGGENQGGDNTGDTPGGGGFDSGD
jgi:predicted histone-like DNA-binding protein